MSKRYFNYEIAVKFGRDESDIVCTIYSWLHTYAKNPTKFSNNFRDNCWWSYNSVQKWHEQFEYIGLTAFKQKLSRLREHGYLIKADKEYNKRYRGKNSTSWFTLDLERLHKDFPTTKRDLPNLPMPNNADMVEKRPTGRSDSDQHLDGFRPTGRSDSDQTIPYTLPDNKNNNTSLSDSDNDLLRRISDIVNTEDSEQMKDKGKVIDFFGRYLGEYHSSRNTEHGSVSDRTLRNAVQNVISLKAFEHTEIIKGYFASEYKEGCDFRIGHFTNKKILQRRLEAVSQPEQTEQKDSGTWRDSLRYLQRNDVDDLMRFYVPARKEGLDLRKLSDTEYADYIRDDTHGVRLDYSEDREFISQCLDELLQLIDKPETEDSIIDEPHGNYETHILPEVEDDEWLDNGPEEQLPF